MSSLVTLYTAAAVKAAENLAAAATAYAADQSISNSARMELAAAEAMRCDAQLRVLIVQKL